MRLGWNVLVDAIVAVEAGRCAVDLVCLFLSKGNVSGKFVTRWSFLGTFVRVDDRETLSIDGIPFRFSVYCRYRYPIPSFPNSLCPGKLNTRKRNESRNP